MKAPACPSPRPPDWWRHAHDPGTISRRAARAAARLGLRRRTLLSFGGDRIEVLEGEGAGPRVYLSAGIHGDEPAGPEALLRWLEGPTARKAAARFALTVIPCLNPGGLRLNSRADPRGNDLNRSFRRNLPVIAAVRRELERRGPFALSLLLHEDYDGCGVYLYELAGKRAPWGDALLAAAARHCPPDPRPMIEGRRARNGLLRRNVDTASFRALFRRVGMAEAPWLFLEGLTSRVYTVETPSEFDLEARVEAHRAIIGEALDLLAREEGIG